MLRAIVGFEIAITSLEGKWKLSQNRPADIEGVREGLMQDGQTALAAPDEAMTRQAPWLWYGALLLAGRGALYHLGAAVPPICRFSCPGNFTGRNSWPRR